jgi:predicted nucleotidyltransferase
MSSRVLKLGYTLEHSNIPRKLNDLIAEVKDVYRECHANLESVYVIGSVVLGEWQQGLSDLDVIGISSDDVEEDDENRRKLMLDEVGKSSVDVSFIDNSIMNKKELEIDKKESKLYIAGQASKIALTGVCVQGLAQNFSEFIPTVPELAFGRTERVELLMKKYRSGNFIKEFKRDHRLITRSCGKAAMRVLSGVTILRGAPYHPSAFRVAENVPKYAPEATLLAKRAHEKIVKPDASYNSAIQLTYEAVELFYDLFEDLDDAA